MDHEIVQDLLALYHDGVCSEKSREAVEAHLLDCPDCREALRALDAPLPVKEPQSAEDATAIKKLSREWGKSKWKAFLKGAAIALALCAGYFAFWFLVTQSRIPLRASEYELQACYLQDGRIAVEVKFAQEGRSVRFSDIEVDPETSRVVTHLYLLRPVLRWNLFLNKEEYENPKQGEYLDHNQFSFDPQDITNPSSDEIYFGWEEDGVLLWTRENGYAIPPATDAEEAFWSHR